MNGRSARIFESNNVNYLYPLRQCYHCYNSNRNDTTMKWEAARKYIHSADVKNIKSIARDQSFKLSGRTIDSIFDMIHESGQMTEKDMLSMERDFESSVGY